MSFVLQRLVGKGTASSVCVGDVVSAFWDSLGFFSPDCLILVERKKANVFQSCELVFFWPSIPWLQSVPSYKYSTWQYMDAVSCLIFCHLLWRHVMVPEILLGQHARSTDGKRITPKPPSPFWVQEKHRYFSCRLVIIILVIFLCSWVTSCLLLLLFISSRIYSGHSFLLTSLKWKLHICRWT